MGRSTRSTVRSRRPSWRTDERKACVWHKTCPPKISPWPRMKRLPAGYAWWPWTLKGLVAASVPKPTVAQYTRCFRYLQVAKFAQESGPYGEAPRHEVMVMLDNFPAKGGSMGVRRVRKSLKRQNLSSASFPKRLLLGK